MCTPLPDWVVNLLQEGAGAFFGALFAFALFLVTDRLTRTRERQKRHHTGLVALEFRFNEYLGVLSDNQYLIAKVREVVNRGRVHWSMPRNVPLGEPVYLDLLSSEIINEYFGVLVDLRKTNDDVENLVHAYERMSELFVTEAWDEDKYKANALVIASGLEVCARAMKQQENKHESLIAKVRVAARKDNPNTRRFWWTTKTASISPEELASELALLRQERKEVAARSRTDIDAVLGE